jgi:type II secretory pathway pseudopilin PulG
MLRKRQPRHRTAAFTLVEVMMAAAILILAIVGMIQVIVSGAEMLDVARKQTIAMQIIHGQLDNVRLSNWTEITALTSGQTVDVDGGDQLGFVFGTNLPTITKGFRCTRAITTVRTDFKQVTFTVTWTGNTGRSYTRSGSTYVGKNGLYVTYQRS